MNPLKLSGAVMAISGLVLALPGCGEQEAQTTTADSTESSQLPVEKAGEPELAPPFGPPTACKDLLDQGWTAPETEPNINFDPSSGLAEVTFTEAEDTIVVDLVNDAACAKLPDVGELLARTQANHDQVLREYCEDLVATLNAGETPGSDGMTADPEGMRNYVRTDCPDDVVQQLR